ncbi:hypothetical protein [Nitrososphaera sp.]|uniref:hypothetical protein n=1 Tax=Nitrososphaera sp. TaxID=1971748 RepID=UPI00307F44D3
MAVGHHHRPRHPYRYLSIALAAGLAAAALFGAYQFRQASLLSDRVFAMEQDIEEKTVQVSRLDAQAAALAGEKSRAEHDAQQWKASYAAKSAEYEKLSQDYGALDSQNRLLAGENESLRASGSLLKQVAESERSQRQNAEAELATAARPPYTLVKGREISWVFKDSKGNLYEWHLPIDTYRKIIESPEPQDKLRLKTTGGSFISVRDHTRFVDGWSFANVVDEVYAKSTGDRDFVYELWFITSQLAGYSTDIGEDPRWPLETFTESGGDCEDLVILMASMLKASAHTSDWKIQMAYFDSANPDRADNVNHVALYVETDSFSAIVETTTKQGGLEYWQGKEVKGWYFDL